MLKALLVSSLLFSLSIYAGVTQPSNTLAAYTLEYHKKQDPKMDLQKAKKVAQKEHKKILLIVGGDWCKWSGTLDNFLEDHPEIAQKFYNSFEVVKVYYGKGMTKEAKNFLKQFPPLKGTPHFYILDENGKLLKSVDTGYLERGYSYNKRKFEQFIEENK